MLHVRVVQVDPGAQPGNTVLPTDITPVQPRTQQDNSTVGLVVGLVVAGVVVGCLGALMMMLLRHRHNRRKWPGSQLKQQAAAQQALVRHRSGASSNGSGEQCCAQHTGCPDNSCSLSKKILRRLGLHVDCVLCEGCCQPGSANAVPYIADGVIGI